MRRLFLVCLSVVALWGGLPAQGLAQVRGLPDFTELVEQQTPVVVNISSTKHRRVRQGANSNSPFDPNDPAFDIFRHFFPQIPGLGGQGGQNAPQQQESQSLGSGFIISSDGYILTNAHVVESADEIKVRLSDKREFRARAIGADKRTDVALLKIEASGLPTARLGTPGLLKVGEWVIAIGSPFGFESSVTAGIVSAKGRSLPRENYVPFIQTDVAINPGNSGGPLFNMRGEVVGINSQIYSRSGGYMGLSFAIPIDVAMDVQQQLRSTGRVTRGRLGAVIQDLTPELAKSLGLAKAQGALVSDVEANGPADKAGLEAGDVVLKFDSKPVVGATDLPRLVGMTRPGTRTTLLVWRQGRERELSVTVGEVQDGKKLSRPEGEPPRPTDLASSKLGLTLQAIPDAEQASQPGSLLVREATGPAARSGVRSGDVIVAVMQAGGLVEIESQAEFNQLLARLEKGSNLTLLLRRGAAQVFTTIRGIN